MRSTEKRNAAALAASISSMRSLNEEEETSLTPNHSAQMQLN